jgi:hypothetical protein
MVKTKKKSARKTLKQNAAAKVRRNRHRRVELREDATARRDDEIEVSGLATELHGSSQSEAVERKHAGRNPRLLRG